MTAFQPPLRHIDFVLNHVVDLAGLARYPAFAHADPDTVRGVLEEAGRFAAEVIAPLDQVGDRQGAEHQADGSVRMPDGFATAYSRYVEAGWPGVGFDPAYGGGGFPWVVALAIQELLSASNRAFALAPMLTQSAIEMLINVADESWKERLLPKMIAGMWSGTMNLTEPQAGSDLGAITTRAVRQPDGSYLLTGQKIFITYGEHDLTENIVHLVLARVPGAPPGTKGISCFIVPKFVVGEDGSLGDRNDVRCVSIEHKVGIHASPTCVLAYGDNGGAVAYLVGEENGGMPAMFMMMNNARLSVALEGLAVSERAFQRALSHAQERRQGRAPGARSGDASAIIDHPDVRRMLVTMRSYIDAMRYLTYTNAASIDRARHDPDPAARAAAADVVELLTPVAKAWCTDLGVELTSIAIQIHGGMGYVEETGIAQHWRDSRISPIYEGTNGIQAGDLVGRKLGLRGGLVAREHLDRIALLDGELEAAGDDFVAIRANLTAGLASLRAATEWMLSVAPGAAADRLAGSTPYLRMFGLVTGGWLHAQAALAATRAAATSGDHDGFFAARVRSAQFFCEQLLPQVAGLLPSATAGAAPLFALDARQLAS
ncbi:MAG TPA: acyl-CoA dehydrogenase [Acidimicrobiales bacterium]|nr:acyl-CoA dehydrogenase [Acidimicrobiales bacterium]